MIVVNFILDVKIILAQADLSIEKCRKISSEDILNIFLKTDAFSFFSAEQSTYRREFKNSAYLLRRKNLLSKRYMIHWKTWQFTCLGEGKY